MRTRRRRSTLPEGYYHVYNRAARRLTLFADDADRGYFLFLAIRAARRFGIPIVAWCLVQNHYHLLLRGSGKALGRMLRELESLYSRAFNRKTGFNGCLFQGRFGSTWLPDMEAVAYVSRYIHGNSLDEGVRPEEYIWSSAGIYLGRFAPPEWMEIDPVLSSRGGVGGYTDYLRDLPVKSKRDAKREEAQSAFVKFLEEKFQRALEGQRAVVGKCSVPVLICLIAIREYALRPRVLAKHFGYSSGKCVSALVNRMEKRIQNMPELEAALSKC